MRNAARTRAVRRVLWSVLFANLAVIAAKIAVGLRSGSIAVLGDAAHSTVDALNNVVALAAIRAAAQPPDEEHPYGHSKFETLGGLAIAAFLSITCFELTASAIGRLAGAAAPPRVDSLTLTVLIVTMGVNLAVALVESRAGRRLDSLILVADARHTGADVLVTLSVIGGLLLVRAGWPAADPWLAIAVALLIARSGYQILLHTIPVLVDSKAVEAERIRLFVVSVEGVLGVTDIRSRGRLGGEAFAELTVEVDGSRTVEEGHRIADAVERKLEGEGGFAAVVVHVEPRAEAAGGEGQAG